MFTSVLVANRGEIACRVFRTARRMGIRTIAVYSEADAKALHVREADEAVLIGPAPARESYLDAAKVLAAARATGAEAIHPGYGFLSENADFAKAVMAAGLVWIGPPPAAIRAMASEYAPRTLATPPALMRISGLEPVNYTPNADNMRATFLNIGERCNVAKGEGARGASRAQQTGRTGRPPSPPEPPAPKGARAAPLQ